MLIAYTLEELGDAGVFSALAVIVAASITGGVAWFALRANGRNHRESLEHQTARFEAELRHDRVLVFQSELRSALVEAASAGRTAVGEVGKLTTLLGWEKRWPTDEEIDVFGGHIGRVLHSIAQLRLSLPQESPIVQAMDGVSMRLAFVLAEAASDQRASRPEVAAEKVRGHWELASGKLEEFTTLGREYLSVEGAAAGQ